MSYLFIYLLYSILNFDKIADNLKQSLLKGSKRIDFYFANR